jgi:3-hydroxyisobutyrate dehydrogenase-like beta-hydroxyacid dehydrogenase
MKPTLEPDVPHQPPRVGLIGIGLIGLAVARNLMDAGYDVIGYRRTNMEPFLVLGGHPARNCGEVIEQADIVLDLLPSVEAFESVFEGPDDLVGQFRPGQIVVSLSTYPIAVKQRQADRLRKRGAVLLDCEISGSPMIVSRREGVVFISGDEEAARRCEPVIKGFADKSFYLGKFGCASKMKLVANHLLALNNLAAAEAMLLGVRSGLDPKLIVDVIGPSAGGSTMFTIRAPMMAERRFVPAPGPLNTLEKYIDMVEAQARLTGTATPLMDAAAACYREALVAARGEEDIAVMYEVLEAMHRPPTDET